MSLIQGIPDYFTVIKNPMDFGTIKKKLNLNIYQNVEGFLNDMSQVFINCRLYNGTESPVGRIGVNIRREYDRLLGMYNFVERFQNSQQVHPSVLFIKDLQGKKKDKIEEEVQQKAEVQQKEEPQKPENMELEIEKKLPLIKEVNANKIEEESQQKEPQEVKEEPDNNKIIEEVPSEPVLVQPEEQKKESQESEPIQIEESKVPVLTTDTKTEQLPQENTVTPVQTAKPEPEIVASPEKKPALENPIPIEQTPNAEDVPKKTSDILNYKPNEENPRKEPENKIKETSEDSLLNDSLKEAKSPEKAETKAPENIEPKPL